MLKSNLYAILTVITIFYCCSNGQILISQCQQYDGVCIRCSLITHLYEGLCYANIPGCLRHQNGNQCVVCDTTVSTLVNKTCQIFQTALVSGQIPLALRIAGLGDRYGDSAFQYINQQDAMKMRTFVAVDNDIRSGQYAFRIKSIADPIISVHYYIKQDRSYSYKILYDGSGGGVFLLISDIDASTLKVTIRSFVLIDLSQLIDYCIDYSFQSVCTLCRNGYHLQNGICYINSGGCIRYIQNICIKCLDNTLLVQNMCVNDCNSTADMRSMLYYEATSICTLQRFSGVPINKFYVNL